MKLKYVEIVGAILLAGMLAGCSYFNSGTRTTTCTVTHTVQGQQ